MIKAALFTLSLAALLALPATVTAQDNAVTLAVNRAVLNQANTIVLRGRLADAKATTQRGDIRGAAKQYQEAFVLAQQIGSGIDAETAQAVAGVVSTRLALAREAQSRHDLIEADTQISQVLKVDPKNSVAIIFKQQNDQMLVAMKPHMPDAETIETIPAAAAQKTDANILMQDGKLFYEMGKLDEAEAKLAQALKLDPDNSGASYYLNLIKQARLSRDSAQHMLSTQTRMEQVEKQWVLPTSKVVLPVPNPYATNNLVYTGPGRQAIVDKLNRIHLDNVSYDGVPLSEVLRQLSEKIRLSDPERKGINFLINPNQDQSGAPVAVPTTGLGGGPGFGGQVLPGLPGANAIDPATGLPATGATPGGAAAGGEPIDAGAFMVKFSLTDVRLADVLNTITMVAQNPNSGDNRTIKYTIQDFAIVFQAKGAESPQLFERSFKVDPNSFYSGLESVSATTFGSSSSSGGGGNGGGGGGGGGNSGGGGGGGNNQNSGAVVGVVNAFAGGGSLRNQGGQGGGGGGGGGGATGQGAVNPLDAGTAGAGGGGGGGVTGGGGLHYITQVTLASSVSAAASAFFTTLGVNLVNPPGKSVFFNDRVGRLFVRATEQDLDTIERAIETLNEVAPMVHIKARFIEVQQNDNKALGFDWYLGNFLHGDVVAGGGSSPSLTVPVSANNPLGAFPGNTVSSLVPASGNDQLLTQGLRNSGPALATMTGILTDPNFRVVLHALEQRDGVEALAEPDVTTISGRQTQMRATQIKNVVTGFSFNNGSANGANATTANGGGNGNLVNQAGIAAVIPNTQQLETGPVLDVVPYVLSDGYTINLALIPSVTEFIGYSSIGANEIPGFNPGSTIGGLNGTTLPVALPNFTIRQVVTTVNVWDNQTVVIGGLISSTVNSIKDKVPVIGDIPMLGRLFQSQSKTTVKKNLMIFVTATIVDPSGSRIHSDDDLPFAQTATPVQPEGYGTTTETVKKVQMPVAP